MGMIFFVCVCVYVCVCVGTCGLFDFYLILRPQQYQIVKCDGCILQKVVNQLI